MYFHLYTQSFGIVAAEAMASGIALVSTGVGGASELFENEISGLSYPPGDSGALANQLEKLARNPMLRRIQQSGQTRVREKFSVDKSALQLERLLTT